MNDGSVRFYHWPPFHFIGAAGRRLLDCLFHILRPFVDCSPQPGRILRVFDGRRACGPIRTAAFCITGLVRTMTAPVVHASMQRNLIEAFGAEAHVFWYLKMEGPQNLDRVREVLKPERWHVVDATKAEPSPCVHEDRNLWHQHMAIKSCYQMVLESEKLKNITYHYVFRVRSDSLFYRRFPHVSYFDRQQKESFYVVRDWFVLATRHFVDAAFNQTFGCGHHGQIFEPQFIVMINKAGPVNTMCWNGVWCYHI
ncbi:unnamed protein product [Polarella glacialis]|uniref:Glycosyltransferase family 92 protein n=1 Tax=Polarella glacialis TaxID=89957 RepID=A0A813IZ47_POLGL|nr:unnamed protein product [Polarella glacialis]